MTAACVPRHHPPSELLIDHAAGAATDAERLMIDTHLALCAECRRGRRDCDAIGGALLDQLAPAWLPPNLLNLTLAAIDDAAGEARLPTPCTAPAHLADMLRRRLGVDLDAGPWRRLPGGIRARRLPLACPSAHIVLMRIPPGRSVFRHAHVGDEWTLVLQGGFSDESGHYGKGDFAWRGPADAHRPVAAAGEDCICLALLRGNLRYLGLAGRVASSFFRL